MDERDRLLQRWQDGRLGAAEGAAMERMARDTPPLQRQVDALAALDADLRQLHAPHRAAPDLTAQVMARVPQRPPAGIARLSWLDLVLFSAIASLGAGTYALAGLSLSRSVTVLWIAGLSVVLGLLLVALPQAFREFETGLWSRVLQRPVLVSRIDVLVYRCLGLVIAGGGWWLLH
jgi:hypothetical protein